jgi:hypothetical protein
VETGAQPRSDIWAAGTPTPTQHQDQTTADGKNDHDRNTRSETPKVSGVGYKPGRPRSERTETERFRAFTYDEVVARDKANLDIVWLKDDSLEDSENLPAPEVIAREIVEDLEAALSEFAAIAETLEAAQPEPPA